MKCDAGILQVMISILYVIAATHYEHAVGNSASMPVLAPRATAFVHKHALKLVRSTALASVVAKGICLVGHCTHDTDSRS